MDFSRARLSCFSVNNTEGGPHRAIRNTSLELEMRNIENSGPGRFGPCPSSGRDWWKDRGTLLIPRPDLNKIGAYWR